MSTVEVGPPTPKESKNKKKGCCGCKDWIKDPVMKWTFPLMALSVVGFIYVVFLHTVLVPQVSQVSQKTGPHPTWRASKDEVVVLLSIFHLLFLLFLYCFLRATFTRPGYVPDSPKWQEGVFDDIDDRDTRRLIQMYNNHMLNLTDEDNRYFLKSFPLVERKFGKNRLDAKNGLRECKYCKLYKPDRSHHCKTCNKCVLRMDHHCPWIANCVGYHNYKFFLLLLAYAVATLVFILVAQQPRLVDAFRQSRVKPSQRWFREDLLVVASYTLSFVLCIFLSIFFSFHLKLAANALSTIEYKEKQGHRNQEIQARHCIAHVKFDYGAYLNFKHVLGPLWMWPLPIAPTAYVLDVTTGQPLREDGKLQKELWPGCYYVPAKGMIQQKGRS